MSPIPFQRRLAEWLIDHRLGVVIIAALATLVLLAPFRDPQVLYRSTAKINQIDDDTRDLREFASKFGEGELLMAVIKTSNVFTPRVLTYVRTATDALSQVPGVQRVVSLTTVKEVYLAESGMATRPLFPEGLNDVVMLQHQRAVALSNPLWVNNLISTDASVTVINVFLPPFTRATREGTRILRQAQEAVDGGKPAEVDVYLTGLSPMFNDTTRYARRDFKQFFWLTWLLMAGLLFLAFRTWRGVLLPLGVIFLSVMWTLGLLANLGQSITSIGAMVPTLIAISCFSDAVHVLTDYYQQARLHTDRRVVVVTTMERMFTACFLTSSTTAVAFGSLLTASLSNIRLFGIWTAVGVMIGYVLNTVLMPVILSRMTLPVARIQNRYEDSYCGKMLGWVAAVHRRGGRWVPGLTGLLLGLALLGIAHIRTETNMACFLPQASPSMRGLAIAQEKLTGFGAIEVVLSGPPGCFREAWALRELAKVEQYLESSPEVGTALSICDLLQWTHSIVEQTQANVLADPNAEGYIAEYLYLYSSAGRAEALASLLTEDASEARISARLRISGTGQQITLIEDLLREIPASLDPRLQLHTAGEADRIHRQVDAIISSQLKSFGFTLGLITLMILIYLRSLKSSLLAMIPNVLPALLTLGIMAPLGITLNFATVMIASIAIGNAINDTIHFLARYRHELARDPDRGKAVDVTLISSGRAMVFSDVAMAIGCGIFVLSEFDPNRWFGVLMVFAMFTALIADLLITPYIARKWRL